jgi:CheY-like chemotaxis protein
MVHGLAEQSGGRLVLSSREGEGTTAELWLPVAEATAGERDAPPAATPDAAALPPPLAVLAVDDDRLVLMNTVAMLEDLGHAVYSATSGAQALDILRRGTRIDLVITDHAMPRMTGMELIGAIRAEWPNLPVILASGYADLASGAHGKIPLLAKPFPQDILARKIVDTITYFQPARREG